MGYGPSFDDGCDIYIADNANRTKSYSNLGQQKSLKTKEIRSGKCTVFLCKVGSYGLSYNRLIKEKN